LKEKAVRILWKGEKPRPSQPGLFFSNQQKTSPWAINITGIYRNFYFWNQDSGDSEAVEKVKSEKMGSCKINKLEDRKNKI
jgi:hypothetical protein